VAKFENLDVTVTCQSIFPIQLKGDSYGEMLASIQFVTFYVRAPSLQGTYGCVFVFCAGRPLYGSFFAVNINFCLFTPPMATLNRQQDLSIYSIPYPPKYSRNKVKLSRNRPWRPIGL
jgi:hypothetical protein